MSEYQEYATVFLQSWGEALPGAAQKPQGMSCPALLTLAVQLVGIPRE